MHRRTTPADLLAREAQSRRSERGDGESTTNPGRPASGNGDTSLRAELAEWKERCLRLAADLDNFRKRTARERERRAAELRDAFVRELLPVVDNLERALANNPAHLAERLGEGVRLTLRQLTRVLNEHGFTGRDDLGRPFDPRYHEAVCVRSDPMQPHHVILEVWESAWLQGESLFRPAKVVVNDLNCSSQTEGKLLTQYEEVTHHG